MNVRHLLLIAAVSAAVVAGLTALLAGCETAPSEPAYDNIFDPDNPGSANGLNVTTTALDTMVIVRWDQPQTFSLSAYDVLHSTEYNGTYRVLDTVEHTVDPTNDYYHMGIEPTTAHYYKVRARTTDGAVAMISNQVPAVAMTRPLVQVGDGNSKIASRYTVLTITVSQGDSLRIAGNEDFTDELRTAAGEPNVPKTIDWDFGPAVDNDEKRRVYVLSFGNVAVSDTNITRLDVDFDPDFSALGDPATVATREIDLVIDAAGVDSMRFALSPEALIDAPWLPGADLLPGFLLADTANPQVIYADFMGDFGFISSNSWDAVPDLLNDATFYLLIGPDRVTDEVIISAYSQAAATRMRLSEEADFTSVNWRAYSDTAVVVLSESAGRKVVYAQYRNDWTDSGIYNDWVDYIHQSLEIQFLAPPDSTLLRAGGSVQFSGITFSPSGTASVDSVILDTGDGEGFRAVNGISYWTYLWEIPDYTDDTPTVVRVRAWAGTDTVTTTRNVTVTQVNVSITEPAFGAVIDTIQTIAIAGTSKPALDGAPLDSLVVHAGQERLLPIGLQDWSVSWTTPAVDQDTFVDIVATVYAGSEADTDTVTVELKDITPEPRHKRR